MENNNTTTTTTSAQAPSDALSERRNKLQDLASALDELHTSRVEATVYALASQLKINIQQELNSLRYTMPDREAYRQRITYRLELVRMIQTSGPALSALNGSARGDRTPALVYFMHEILAAERLTPWHAAYDCQHAETCAQ